jgi:hypothetical protein
MRVLLRLVRVVPGELGLEAAALAAVDADHLGAHDAFERVQDGAGAEPLDGIAPLEALAQIDGVVVPVRIPEPDEEAPRQVPPEGVDQLLAQQSHCRRAEDDDALFVQTDDAEVRTEVEQFRQLQPVELGVRRVRHRC